jgi:hypothetical protein
MKRVLIEPHYFPSVAFWVLYMQAEEVVLDIHAHYEKQSYRNRCEILTDKGVWSLSVPVCKPWKRPLHTIEIDNRHAWQKDHIRAIEAAYRKAPFFEYFAPEILTILEKPMTTLLQLQQEILTTCLKLLQLPNRFTYSTAYYDGQQVADLELVDMRNVFHPKKKQHLNITCEPYTQNFGAKFVPNLSILDVLFCMGPAARLYLRQRVQLPLSERVAF